MSRKHQTVTALLCTLAAGGAGAGAAYGGEITGNGKPVIAPTVAHSVCSFSGKNDNPTNPQDNPDAGGVSQSYGQLNRLGIIASFFHATPKTFNPGDTCRGNLPPQEG
jgi:hypothetical protein